MLLGHAIVLLLRMSHSALGVILNMHYGYLPEFYLILVTRDERLLPSYSTQLKSKDLASLTALSATVATIIISR